MRILLVLLVACVPHDIQLRAQESLHSGRKHTWIADHDVIGDREVYVFCRDEHRDNNFFGPRHYDGACIVLTCPPNAPAKACDEAPF